MKKIEGLLSDMSYKRFPKGYGYGDVFNWVGVEVSLEHFVAVSGLLSPPFYLHLDSVFLSKAPCRYSSYNLMPNVAGKEIVDIERFYNFFYLEQFFSFVDEDGVQWSRSPGEFGDLLAEIFVHYWSVSLKEKFPHRSFVFEVGDNMFDNEGIGLTFYQQR